MKKRFILIVFALFLILPLKLQAQDIPSIETVERQTNLCSVNVYPLQRNIKNSIENIYGKNKADVIYSRVEKIIQKTKAQRTLDLYKEDLYRSQDWYKDEIMYIMYADQFGVDKTGKPNTFKDLIPMLGYLQDLGVTTLYILPFMDSPMQDSGFDVSNPREVRGDLGGLGEFVDFAHEAQKRGIKIKADLILNHFSDQHQWFQDAINGDLSKLNYFLVKKNIPPYLKYKDKKLGWIVEYFENFKRPSKRRLMFPDITDSQYRKVTINCKDYYLYHTFYPFQLDVNWKNPEVLYYMLETIAFWANIGVDIFRMDAIPYLIKQEGTTAENLRQTHQLVELLSSFLQEIAPRSVMQAEACQLPKDILPYFGHEEKVHYVILGKNKQIIRTNQVQIAYHFPYMPSIWATLVTKDSKHFWQAYEQTPKIPPTTSWAQFLRLHDELTLEMTDLKTRAIVFGNLVKKGQEFKKGLGVSGRMANFLDNNPDRINLAFSILMSLPGIPMIYYGDEIAAQNNYTYAKEQEINRKEKQEQKGQRLKVLSYYDSRDINRGPIEKEALYHALNNNDRLDGIVYHNLKNLIRIRRQNPVFARGSFYKVNTKNPEIFCYLRSLNHIHILVVNNLSNKEIEAQIYIQNKTSKNLDDLISGKKIAVKNDKEGLKISLAPYQALWLKI